MRNLAELGFRKFGSRPFAPLVDNELREFEATFGISLPADYIQFLRFANGGTLDMCEYDDKVTGGRGGINDFYGLGNRGADAEAATHDRWEFGNLWGETRVFHAHIAGPIGVPISRDGGGNQLFLDYREDRTPCVSRSIIASRQFYRVAASFSELLDMLQLPTPSRSVSSPRNFRC